MLFISDLIALFVQYKSKLYTIQVGTLGPYLYSVHAASLSYVAVM